MKVNYDISYRNFYKIIYRHQRVWNPTDDTWKYLTDDRHGRFQTCQLQFWEYIIWVHLVSIVEYCVFYQSGNALHRYISIIFYNIFKCIIDTTKFSFDDIDSFIILMMVGVIWSTQKAIWEKMTNSFFVWSWFLWF